MSAFDFRSIVALGAAIAALLTFACLLLTPTLGGSRATRYLSIGNLCFTVMLVVRLGVGFPPSAPGYAAIWSMLILTSATHLLAVREVLAHARRTEPGAHGGPADGRSRVGTILAATAVSLAALWIALAASPSPQAGAVVTGVSTFAAYVAAVTSSRRLPGTHLALPRRTLAAAFGAGGAFAALHVVQRLTDVARGVAEVPATAVTYFGAVLLFCTINVGFLLLLYLQLAERVHRLAQTDELTGALNRRGLARQLARLRDDPGAEPTGALLLIDIDRFKSVNDSHGHAVGDEVLRWFAQTVRAFMRADDLLTRMGGEEFCLLLPGVSDAQAARIAERIRVEFEANSVAPTSAGPLRITASFGLASYGSADAVLDARLREADQALYAAKRGGRNRVVRWAPELGAAAPA